MQPAHLASLPSLETLAPRRVGRGEPAPAPRPAPRTGAAAPPRVARVDADALEDLLDELFALPDDLRGWMEVSGLLLAAMGVPTLWAVLLVLG